MQIADEQARLTSMSLGTQVLARIWAVEPKTGKEIPIKTRGLLVQSGYKDAARALTEHKIAPRVVEGFTLTEVAGLEDLLHYLDAKRCLMGELGESCPEYTSLSKKVVMLISKLSRKSSEAKNPSRAANLIRRTITTARLVSSSIPMGAAGGLYRV